MFGYIPPSTSAREWRKIARKRLQDSHRNLKKGLPRKYYPAVNMNLQVSNKGVDEETLNGFGFSIY